jgi:hypothetical protein
MGFQVEKGKVLYYAEPTYPGQAGWTLKNVDLSTFVVFNSVWAKDHKHVWAASRPVRAAYAPAFQALNDAFGRDNEGVFDSLGRMVKGVNAAAFEVLDDGLRRRMVMTRSFEGYARCEGKIYHYASWDHKTMLLRGADASTFRVLKWGYGCDTRRVYSGNLLVKGAKAETFRQITPWYSTDGQGVFYFSQTVVGADPETFEPFGADFWKGDDPQPEAIRGRNDMWARDRNHVYFQRLVMEGLDPTTAQIVGGMLKDATQVNAGYRQPIEGADAPSFEPVPGSFSYYRDRWRVYHSTKPIEGADPATFEALPQRHPSKGDAWDANWIYQHENRWKPRSEFAG